MGVDYAIHLVSRFQAELKSRAPQDALEVTLRSTGRSVATSGATTAVALLILSVSDFRGFSDFGIIGGTSIAVITISMLLVWPACAIAGERLGLVEPRESTKTGWALPIPASAVMVGITVLVALSIVVAYVFLEFDYDFTNLSAKIPGREEISDKQSQVYPATSAPAALYVARDLEGVDDVVALLEQKREETADAPTIGTINSIRNFAPSRAQFERRVATIREMTETLEGRWVKRIEDPDRIEIIEDFLSFEPPTEPPTLEQVPNSISRELMARDGSGELLVTVDTDGRSRDGRMAMAFTEDIYEITLPDTVRGPTGERLVLAEILFMVTEESAWMVALTFGVIFMLVFVDRRSFRQTVWVLVPLVAGIVLTLGLMVALGWKLNFFNMVVLPTMLGVGVDHGVHYYRRWRELRGDTETTHHELFGPITIASLTTLMGYLGMVLAHHPGLRSIGSLALLGLTATWFTALVLLPGLLCLRQILQARG
jgi:predicted RND superfamily exporter protein